MLKRSLVLVVVAGAVAICVLWIRARRSAGETTAAASPPAEYTGASACRDCHAAEYEAWRTSDHSQAMQPAEAGRVLGTFNRSTFRYGSITSTFFERGGKYWVRTDDPSGVLQDFEIKYTFGVAPLQQYLIELPGGRLQALSVAWDSRPKSAGGQRWFHLYPGDGVDHTDELHWTGRQQNWNFMCADCHSTNVRKGYDAATDRFATAWSELTVGCESCHGPGSDHVRGARIREPGRRARGAGLTVHFTERRDVHWNIDPATLLPRRSAPRTASVEIDVCAQCHSRREQIAEGYRPGAPLEDYYAPSLIAPGLYFADGQQRDEVYTYASFLQSKMGHAGVTCSDCHEPHTQRLRVPGNTLCAQCHAPAKYDTTAHHFHPGTGAATQCVSCHMPPTTYMQVDARRDHSFRVPRPDRTATIGVPNACSGCHTNKTAEWADEQIRKKRGTRPAGFQTFAEAFHGAEANRPSSDDALGRVADDASLPPIVRASALARLAGFPGRIALDAATKYLTDPQPIVRRAALQIFEAFPPEARGGPAAPLLKDPLRAVRLQAAWVLAPTFGAGAESDAAFSRAAEEFIASRRYRADRPEDRTTLGTFFAHLNRRAEAKAEYRAALRLAPRYTPAYVNLSDLQREEGSEQEAEHTLRQGLSVLPTDAILHHALGLSLARSQRQQEAVAELKRATELSNDVQFAYTYAVALNSSGRAQEAIAYLERARTREPQNRDVLFALATFLRDIGRTARALDYAEQLQAAYPNDAEARELVASLRAALPPHRPQ